MADDWLVTLAHGDRDGEEDYDAPSVDEGGRADPKDARARKLKRSYAATRQKAPILGVALGGGPGRKSV
jgi:hypothetical protein